LIVLSILVFLIANIPVIALIFLWMILVGVCAVFWLVRSQALLQEEISDEYRGRAFGALGTITALMTVLGMLLAGIGGEWLSITFMVNLVGVTYLVAGLLGLVMLRGAKTSRFTPEAYEKAGDD
jgi:MFS family permease